MTYNGSNSIKGNKIISYIKENLHRLTTKGWKQKQVLPHCLAASLGGLSPIVTRHGSHTRRWCNHRPCPLVEKLTKPETETRRRTKIFSRKRETEAIFLLPCVSPRFSFQQRPFSWVWIFSYRWLITRSTDSLRHVQVFLVLLYPFLFLSILIFARFRVLLVT